MSVEQAIVVVAQRIIAVNLRADVDRGVIEWADYDDVGGRDWDAIVARVHQYADQIDPTNAQYAEAYAHLTARAEGAET